MKNGPNGNERHYSEWREYEKTYLRYVWQAGEMVANSIRGKTNIIEGYKKDISSYAMF